MARQILFSATELYTLQATTECVVFDCRFVLDNPGAGFEDYLESHIPGSVNYPYNLNLNASGAFKSTAEIRLGLAALIGHHNVEDLVHMCGSGVTACNNLFAAELVGLTGSRLYVGSWSEWIQDPSRPVGL